MKLRELPSLVQARLIRATTITEMFVLSLCSRKMKNFIKYKCFPNFLNVSKVKFVFKETKFMILIETTDGKRYPVISTETIPQFIEEGGPYYFEVGNVKVDHCLERVNFHPGQVNIVYLKEFEENFEKALVDHASTLFPNSPALQLETDLHRNLPIMTGIQQIHLLGQYYQGIENKLESFLAKHPNLNSIHIKFKPKDLDYFSKLVRTPNICGYGTNLMRSNILDYFKGRVAIFWNAICVSDVLKVFLRKWIKYRLYENLKMLHIDLNQISSNQLNPLNILENIQTKEWDPNQRPQFFEYEHPIMGYRKQITIQDCSTWIDIEREQDGKLASVKIEHNCFYFYVWN